MSNVYGRARRLTIVKIILILIAIVIFVGIGIKLFLSRPVVVPQEKSFDSLQNYLVSLGYICDDLNKEGSFCNREKENKESTFRRYEEGFSYTLGAKSYVIEIRHVKNMYHEIVLTTNDNAFLGSRNKRYTCLPKDSFLGEVASCKTDTGEEIKIETYIGAVESALYEVKTMLEVSTYDVESLLKNYEWK